VGMKLFGNLFLKIFILLLAKIWKFIIGSWKFDNDYVYFQEFKSESAV